MALQYHLFPYMSDNYGVLIHDDESGQTAAVDAGEAQPLLDALAAKGWSLTQLWITHHHGDHTAGLIEVKNRTDCKVFGPKERSAPIKGIDQYLDEGDHIMFGDHRVDILHTPGHTLDMINFHLIDQKVVFSGDTLFSIGCGRIFEGDPHMMWNSLSKFLPLPRETVVYGSHEYTLANARFAVTVDPENTKLAQRLKLVEQQRADGVPTVPSSLGDEFDTNPFLRAADASIRKFLNMQSASDAEVFAEIRSRKDNA